MTDQESGEKVPVKSTRFGDLEVPAESLITLPSGMVGFSTAKRFFVVDYKPPFSWFHSADEPSLAFVVVDGFEFGDSYKPKAPVGAAEIDLKEEDEYAILVVVTVPDDPGMATANLKAPIFVNMRNMLGMQVIFDDPKLSTRFPLWTEEQAAEAEAAAKEEAEVEAKAGDSQAGDSDAGSSDTGSSDTEGSDTEG